MEQLGIDFKLMLAQAINFIVFFFIYKKFVAKPFRKFIKREREKEKEKEVLLEQVKEKESSLNESYRQYEDKVRRESLKILEKTKLEGEEVKAKIIAEAKQEAEEIKERTKKQMISEKKKMDEEARSKAVDLAVVLVKEGLNNYLDDHSRRKLTSYILNNSPKLLTKYENRQDN